MSAFALATKVKTPGLNLQPQRLQTVVLQEKWALFADYLVQRNLLTS
jgi:hypothetical protein